MRSHVPARQRVFVGALILSAGLALVACSPERTPDPAPAPSTMPGVPHDSPGPTPSPAPTAAPTARPFDASAAKEIVERLAALGPREATSGAYGQGADLVATELDRLGYVVTRQWFDVPAGTSWGVRVPAGTTHNVVADPPGFDPAAPHVVIGAHLDTVPQSPGAEDNASGVAVMLELARMAADQPADLPVRFIAFGAEEPRGSGDERHHYGSRHYVEQLDDPGKQAIVAMVSLDRVGVRSATLPIAHGGRGTDRIARALADAAPSDLPTRLGANTTSDHWSFEKADIPAARIGSVPFEGYHSRGDVPAVVDEDQLQRAGTVVWAWLRSVAR